MVGFLPGRDTTPPAVSSSSTDLENPPPPSRAAAAEQRQTSGCRMIFVFLVMLAILGGMIFFLSWIVDYMAPPQYSVGIDSVSGLDPATDLRLPVLHPAFNLTIRVASASHRYKKCVRPGTYVEVAYRCITLAASPTAQRLCVGPGEAADQQLVARGTGVRVPGTVMDSLAADIRQGQQVFQVTIQSGDSPVDGGSPTLQFC
ncbi:hypothetical protein ACQ4PT_016704 [Festuca glaucescens]